MDVPWLVGIGLLSPLLVFGAAWLVTSGALATAVTWVRTVALPAIGRGIAAGWRWVIRQIGRAIVAGWRNFTVKLADNLTKIITSVGLAALTGGDLWTIVLTGVAQFIASTVSTSGLSVRGIILVTSLVEILKKLLPKIPEWWGKWFRNRSQSKRGAASNYHRIR